MIKINFKYIFFFILIFTLNNNLAFSSIKSEIIFKINQDIITNIDLENEKKFLLFLNPNLENLSKQQIENISIDSIKNRKIKELELRKYFDLSKDGIGKVYVDNFINNSNLTDMNLLLTKLSEKKLQFNFFEKNFIIDNLWREFIYNKFRNQIKVDIANLKKQIETQVVEIEELKLSEILYENKPNIKTEDLAKNIYDEIKKSGFEAAASIYSVSESKKFGGKLGWIRSNQISKQIYFEIKKSKELTSPIKTNNGYLILKIHDRKKLKEKVDVEKELKKLINTETEKELNKLGYIYFNKIKKRAFISEK